MSPAGIRRLGAANADAYAHRDHRAELKGVRHLSMAGEKSPRRSGNRCENDIVDRSAEPFLDPLHFT
jgi:hypothetical protein